MGHAQDSPEVTPPILTDEKLETLSMSSGAIRRRWRRWSAAPVPATSAETAGRLSPAASRVHAHAWSLRTLGPFAQSDPHRC